MSPRFLGRYLKIEVTLTCIMSCMSLNFGQMGQLILMSNCTCWLSGERLLSFGLLVYLQTILIYLITTNCTRFCVCCCCCFLLLLGFFVDVLWGVCGVFFFLLLLLFVFVCLFVSWKKMKINKGLFSDMIPGSSYSLQSISFIAYTNRVKMTFNVFQESTN